MVTADWTLNAIPLLSIPISEFNNEITTQTINDNPSLFQIITPINIDKFELLLKTHPSQRFVKSVCKGLREGFWPWADTLLDGYPTTHDESQPSKDDVQSEFLRSQIQVEQNKDRFSHSFGSDLLPGMYSMPIHAVPKPRSTDLQMVTDHSAGRFSLNSMIPHDDIASYPLDNLRNLGEILLNLRDKIGSQVPLILFKSDVAEAYRLLPVHKKWCNAFGGRASGSLWIAFNSLVTWIARNIR